MFDYIIITDFEATCDEPGLSEPLITSTEQEIIEFPLLLFDISNQCVIDKKQWFVRPIEHPELTPFCTKLTGISTKQLSSALSLPEVLNQFENYIEENIFSKGKTCCLLTDGSWDLEWCFPVECKRKGIIPRLPYFFLQYFDLQKEFRKYHITQSELIPFHPLKRLHLKFMSKCIGAKLVGHHHSGIDDCYSILAILLRLFERGHSLNEPIIIPSTFDPINDYSRHMDFTAYQNTKDMENVDYILNLLQVEKSQVLNLYHFGPRVWYTHPSLREQWRFIVVVRNHSFRQNSFTIRNTNVTAKIRSENQFQKLLEEHDIPSICCLHLPKSFIMLENRRFTYNLKIRLLRFKCLNNAWKELKHVKYQWIKGERRRAGSTLLLGLRYMGYTYQLMIPLSISTINKTNKKYNGHIFEWKNGVPTHLQKELKDLEDIISRVANGWEEERIKEEININYGKEKILYNSTKNNDNNNNDDYDEIIEEDDKIKPIVVDWPEIEIKYKTLYTSLVKDMKTLMKEEHDRIIELTKTNNINDYKNKQYNNNTYSHHLGINQLYKLLKNSSCGLKELTRVLSIDINITKICKGRRLIHFYSHNTASRSLPITCTCRGLILEEYCRDIIQKEHFINDKDGERKGEGEEERKEKEKERKGKEKEGEKEEKEKGSSSIKQMQVEYRIVAFPYERIERIIAGSEDKAPSQLNWSTVVAYEHVEGRQCTLYWYNDQWMVGSTLSANAHELIPLRSDNKSILNSDDTESALYKNDKEKESFTLSQLFWNTFKSQDMKLPSKKEGNNFCYMFDLLLYGDIEREENQKIVCNSQKENKGKHKLLLHGIRELSTLQEIKPDIIATTLNWQVVNKVEVPHMRDKKINKGTINELRAVCRSLSYSDPSKMKGFILVDSKFRRIKVRSRQYSALLKLQSSPNFKFNSSDDYSIEEKREMLEVVRSLFTTIDSIIELPHLRKFASLYKNVRDKYNNLCSKLQEILDSLPLGESKDSRREFAKAVKSIKCKFYKPILFGVKNSGGLSLKEYFAFMNGRVVQDQLYRAYFIDE